MTTATISIPIDPVTAKAYAGASVEDQRKMKLLLSLRLRELTQASGSTLQAVMDSMADGAAARGLTPQALDGLLHG